MQSKLVNALVWIKDILEIQCIPYQIVGGLAANIHGASRPVADIDLYIPENLASDCLSLVGDYMSKPLDHYHEGSWDLLYFQLIYKKQKIEIGLSPGTKIRDYNTGNWVELKVDYSRSQMGCFEGLEVPIIPVGDLVAYKSLLAREVDVLDIKELTALHNLND